MVIIFRTRKALQKENERKLAEDRQQRKKREAQQIAEHFPQRNHTLRSQCNTTQRDEQGHENCSVAQTTNSQQDSLFFRLPYELRERIYRDVLGGHFFHIICTRRRLAHILCTEDSCKGQYTRWHACWGYTAQGGLLWLRALSGRHHEHQSLMGLLRTCRRVWVLHDGPNLSLKSAY